MTETPEARQANAAMEAIRIEYMRGLPDAYAGGPRGRELSWDRLRNAIEHYALRIADVVMKDASAEWNRRYFEAPAGDTASDPAPTMSPAVDPPADPGPVDDGAATAEPAEAAAPPARRPTSRRPRPTRTTDQAEPAETETREEES